MITVCIVPVRDQPEMTARFLDCMLEQQIDHLLVLDNGSKKPTLDVLRTRAGDARLDVMHLPELGIYDLWNAGADYADELREAEALEGVNLLVCNNDVLLQSDAVEILAAGLRSRRDLWAVYPDQDAAWDADWKGAHPIRLGRGVARDGGLYGPAFMVALDRIPWRPLVSDTRYEWWFGDNHLARQIEEDGGKHGRLAGVPVQHENEGTARHHPETLKMRDRDRRRWTLSQRGRGTGHGTAATRRMPPGTKVWKPGGQRRSD